MLCLTRCGEEPAAAPYVARVGEERLTEADIKAALAALPAGRDTADARQQFVEQWVVRALLYREARRRGLQNDSAVQEQLAQSRRSVLTSALLSQLYEEAPAPSRTELQTYYDEHQEQLRLRDPFVRVRHLATADAGEAEAVRQALTEADQRAATDSLWPGLARQYAADPAQAEALASNYVAEPQLFAGRPALRAALVGLSPGEVAPVVEAAGQFHVLQLAERVPAGTVPELDWIEGEVRERLLRQMRKQMVARQVQRLRNEAASRDALDVR